MAEYIDREAVERLVSDACKECREACLEFDGIYADCHQCLFERVKDGVPKIPAADVAPVRHGRWTENEEHRFDCSECGYRNIYYKRIVLEITEATERYEQILPPYCPNCGADMMGEPYE